MKGQMQLQERLRTLIKVREWLRVSKEYAFNKVYEKIQELEYILEIEPEEDIILPEEDMLKEIPSPKEVQKIAKEKMAKIIVDKVKEEIEEKPEKEKKEKWTPPNKDKILEEKECESIFKRILGNSLLSFRDSLNELYGEKNYNYNESYRVFRNWLTTNGINTGLNGIKRNNSYYKEYMAKKDVKVHPCKECHVLTRNKDLCDECQ